MSQKNVSGLSYLQQGLEGKSAWWSWLCVFAITVVVWLVAQTVLIGIMVGATAALSPDLFQEFVDISSTVPADGAALTETINKMMGASPITLALFLLTFPAALIGLYSGQKFIHKRSLTSLHTAFKRFRFARALQGFFVIWGVLAVATFLAKALGAPVNYIFDPARFLGFFIVSLLFIPLQSATEEIIFRGYFNQALGNFINNKWIVFTLTSLAFMALHLSNPEALEGAKNGELPIVMSGYFFFGFACCILVMIDDGLESAIGLHAGNNTFAAIFVNYEGSVLPTPSIWQTVPDPTKDAIGTIITLTVAVAILYYLKPKAPREYSLSQNGSPTAMFD